MKIPKAYAQIGAVKTAPRAATNKLVSNADQELSTDLTKLDLSFLPFAAKAYKISSRIEDYVLKAMPLMPSDLPNRNGIGFPLDELIAFQPPPMNRQVYKAWQFCPVHEEHKNDNPEEALGLVFDVSLRQVKTHGDGKLWMVHGLVGVDKTKYPKIAKELVDGVINTGSMGALATHFSCSVCGQEVSDNSMLNCGHISTSKDVNWKIVDHQGKRKLAYLKAHGLSPIEFSIVRDPAWVMALADGTFNF
jgi:hypothetical protein